MIEALMVIGGVIGVSAVGLFVSGRMTKWWSSALYALITASLGLLMIAGIYATQHETSGVASLWYTRLSFAAIIVGLTSLYFLFQELIDSRDKSVVDKVVDGVILVAGITLTVLCFTPFVLVDVFSEGAVTASLSEAGALFILFFTTATLVLIAAQIIRLGRTAYRKKYGRFDSRFLVVRTVSYVCSLFVTVLVYAGVVTLFSWLTVESDASLQETMLSPLVIFAALVAALTFQTVKNGFDTLTERILYPENYSLNDFSLEISKALNATNDLRTLLERVSEVIARTVKAKQVFFFVQLLEDHYMTSGTEGHARVTELDFREIPLKKEGKARILLPAQFDSHHSVRRMMVSHRLELIMQLRKGDAIVGYLCLGKAMNAGYTTRDIFALRSFADQLSIAIQNALSVDEVKKLNDTLEQRVSSATKELRRSNTQLQRLDEAKDEFISMASHQLRTPLTSIKGYISMLLEGDAGALTKEQKHFLNEAFVSSERMVRLIGDFLNVSRLQTGKFVIEKHPVDLALLVQREIDGLSQNAAARGIRFTYKKPKDIPLLQLDENKIQQVVMNFADNAIYYSKDTSKVVVTLKKTADGIEFTVKDSGIGVPKDDQAHLFQKFFRATNARKARPDGTGVGLFLAQKVISDHDGKIIFESKEGKGSTFGFRLPLPRTTEK